MKRGGGRKSFSHAKKGGGRAQQVLGSFLTVLPLEGGARVLDT